MDLFSPRQFVNWHAQLVIPATRWHTNTGKHASKVQDDSVAPLEPATASPVYGCFKVIALLNLPPVLGFQRFFRQAISATLQQEKGGVRSYIKAHQPVAQSLKSFTEDKRLMELLRTRFQELARPWLDRFALNMGGKYSKPWTLITHAFLHLEPIHYTVNMLGLWALAPACAQIPDLDIKHICAIVVGSSISGGIGNWLQSLVWSPLDTPESRGMVPYAAGASAIVSGFLAIVSVAEPRSWTTISFSVMEFRMKAWFLAALTVTRDVVGLLGQLYPSVAKTADLTVKAKPKMIVGHGAHLMGMLFGLAYYHLFLKRSRALKSPERTMPDRRNASSERSGTQSLRIEEADDVVAG
ncbi:hypothetical protein AC578_10673 [Pseudocercospora eumusae]|uniref:Peptidase S54 rhomboid domain-containing protein n=1 Tax=Pseudocercospora eumusae TaxID=321146 RepID=A0A139HJK1_9PEZI|nr:hypothetical protein AC578_10673 [Pseudocercospora eumusae]